MREVFVGMDVYMQKMYHIVDEWLFFFETYKKPAEPIPKKI